MRKLVAAAAALCTAALVGGTLSAPATGAPGPTSAKPVNLAPLPAKSEVGKRITVKGTVASGRATVRIQRRYSGGGWQTVARTTSARSGAYAVKVRLVRGGTTSFRAVKGTARSSARSLKVYQWLDLATQPYLGMDEMYANESVRLNGRVYRRSFVAEDGGGLVATLNRLCTRGEAAVGFRDVDAAQVPEGTRTGAIGVGFTAGGQPVEAAPQATLTPLGRVKKEVFQLTGATSMFMEFGFVGPAPEPIRSVLGSPRVYCNAPALPALDEETIPLRSRLRGLTRR